MKPNRAVTFGAYAVTFLLIVLPITEITLRLWPLQPGAAAWRFGATGLLTNAMVTPLLGLLLGGGLAFTLGHRAMVRLHSILAILGATLLLGLTLLFILDAIQMRREVQAESIFVFDVAAVQSFAKLCVVQSIAFVLGVGAWRSTGHGGRASLEEEATSRPGIVARRDG